MPASRKINTLSGLDVVILCGGAGTRLRSVLRDIPKPMAPLENRPFLDILITCFAEYGARRFILCTGCHSHVIRDYYARPEKAMEFVISNETEPLGTAGAVANAQHLIRTDPFLLANGDSFCPADLSALLRWHRVRKARFSMVVTRSENPSDCGQVRFDSEGRIIAFDEKKTSSEPGYVNAGIYLLQKDILPLIPKARPCSLEYDLFSQLPGCDSYAYLCESPLIDIGTPQRYGYAKKYFSDQDPSIRD